MPNPRAVAFRVLLKIEQDGAYSNLALNHAIRENKLSGVDSAFVSALVYGVLERKITLDYIIKQYSKIPFRKIETKTKTILRMGVFQLLFMDKVPDSAAVNESVDLAKRQRLQQSAGFINGILRSITRTQPPYTLPDKKDIFSYYSIGYAVPQSLVKLWLAAYGETNTEQLLQSLGGRPKLYIRVNTLKTDKAALKKALEQEGVVCEDVPALENALSLSHTGSIERLAAYKKGWFHVQDLSSQLCVACLAPQPDTVLHDVCAAPGGKAFTAAQYMQNRGKIYACDLFDHKIKLMRTGARRLGVTNILAGKRDAATGMPLPLADRILCDVPCSGLGILSRKPEIRSKEDLLPADLPQLQYQILCHSAERLASGGTLVYSTCTLHPAENGDNVRRFLEEHPDFAGEPLTLPQTVQRAVQEHPYEITLMPHTAATDGFYLAKLKKR